MGIIKAKTSEPIQVTAANARVYSDYTFSFELQTDLPAGGSLEVEFPSGQYRLLLGIPLHTTCSVPCIRTDYTVRFAYSAGLAKNQTHTVTVKNIMNPDYSGGTGNFKLKTIKGSNTLDLNLIFGTIGIGDGVKQLTSVLLTSTDLKAGNVSNYSIQFKTISA